MSKSKGMKFDNIDFYINLSLNIGYYRRLCGYTQAQLAEIVDLSPSFLGALEAPNCERRCSLETLFDIARALNIEPYKLLKPKD